jgi:hypothetical protein
MSEEGKYVPRKGEKPPKIVKTFQEQGEEMKKMFGQEYKGPYDKYDLHLPRTSVPGGPVSQYERLNRKDDFRRTRNLLWFGVVIAVGYSIREYFKKNKHWKKSDETAKMYLEEAELRQVAFNKASKIMEERKEETKKIVEEKKRK